MENSEKPAYPVNETDLTAFRGLTKREHFAAMAMQGLLTRVPNRINGETDLGIIECQRIAEESIIMADKILAELSKTT